MQPLCHMWKPSLKCLTHSLPHPLAGSLTDPPTDPLTHCLTNACLVNLSLTHWLAHSLTGPLTLAHPLCVLPGSGWQVQRSSLGAAEVEMADFNSDPTVDSPGSSPRSPRRPHATRLVLDQHTEMVLEYSSGNLDAPPEIELRERGEGSVVTMTHHAASNEELSQMSPGERYVPLHCHIAEQSAEQVYHLVQAVHYQISTVECAHLRLRRLYICGWFMLLSPPGFIGR